MASTEFGERLTELQYRQQVALRAGALRQLLQLWPAFDLSSFAAIDGSWPAVEEALSLLVGARYTDSAGLAAGYFTMFRAAEGVGGQATAVLAEPLPEELVSTSLKVTGPYTAKHLLALRDPKATDKTLVRLSGSLSRLVSTGGRDTIERSVRADKHAVGYARVASPRACAFCRLLAGRGFTYRESTVKFRSHDHCSCTAEPAYHRDQPLPPSSQKARQLYEDVKSSLAPGEDILTAYRKAVDAS